MFKKIFITNFYVRLNAWQHTKATCAFLAAFVFVVVLGAVPVFGTTIESGQTVLTSTISGAITLNGGTLQADGAVLSNGITVNGGTIDANGNILKFSSNSDSNLTGSGSLTLQDTSAGGKFILGAGGSGSAYSFPGSGLSYTGNLTIASGTVVGNVKNAASVTLNGTYDIGGSGKSLTNLSGFGTITNNGNGTAGGGTTNANISLTNTANSTFSGTIQDGASPNSTQMGTNLVIKAGLYTQTLAGTNTYTGTTTLNSGILNIPPGSSIGSGGLIFTGGILQATSASAIPTPSNITVSGNNAIIDTMGNTIDLSGCSMTLPQAYPLTIVGGGSVTLPDNTWTVAYAPGTAVTYSGMAATNAAIISNILTNGITTTVTNPSSTFGTNAIVLDGGALQAGADCDIANLIYVDSNGGTIDPNGYVLNLSGGVLGPGALTLGGTGGSVIGDISSVASVTVNGTYDIYGSVKSLTNLTGTGTITNNGGSGTIKLTNTADASFSGAITDGTNPTNLVIDAGSFTQILAGTNTYTGTTLVKSGKIQFGSGATVPTNITLSGGYLRNNGNNFSATMLTLADSTTSTLDVNGSDVSFASALGASSGNLNIGDSTLEFVYPSSTKKVYLGIDYLNFSGFVGLYNGVTLGDYPNYIPTDLYFSYGDMTTANLGALPNVVTTSSYFGIATGLPTISGLSLSASQGAVSGDPATTITYTPSGTFNGNDIVTCGFQDLRFFTGDSDFGIGSGGDIRWPYPVGGGQITNIHVCPPSAIPSGGITLTDVDFANFGANYFGSTTTIHGITGVNGFTAASGTPTLTVTLTNPNTLASAPQTINGIIADGNTGGTVNLSVTGSSTLTLGGANNTYTGTTSIDTSATLVGDISSSSRVAVLGTYDMAGSNRTVAIDSSGANGLFTSSTGSSPTLTLTATANSNFGGTIDGTIGDLVVGGSETLTLSGANAYTGTTKINSGATLSIPNASAISANTIDLSGGVLSVANSTSFSSTQNISLSANSTITVGTNPGDSASTAGAIALNGKTLTITGGTLTMGSYPLTGTITPTLVWETSAPTTTFYTDYNTPLTSESLSVPSGGAGTANYTVTILYGSVTETPISYGQSASYNLPNGTLAVNGDGTFTYTPTGSSATETFTYQITDPSGLAANTLSENITINIATPITVNSAIVKGFDFSTGIKTFTGTFSGVASGGTGPYIYQLSSTAGTYGTASIISGVNFRYTPTSVPAPGDQDIFNYRAYDVNGLVSAVGTVTLTNTYTIGGDSTVTVPYKQSVLGTLAAFQNGSGTYSYAVTIDPSYGTVTISPLDGSFTYTNNPLYFSDDSFTYTVTDTIYGCVDTKTVTINTIADLCGVSLTLTDSDSAIFSQNITNSTGTATLTLNSTSGSMNLSGNLTDGGNVMALSIQGAGATLSGSNTYAGGTTVFAGTLTVTSSSSGGTGDITFASGSALNAVSGDGAPIILSNSTYFGLELG